MAEQVQLSVYSEKLSVLLKPFFSCVCDHFLQIWLLYLKKPVQFPGLKGFIAEQRINKSLEWYVYMQNYLCVFIKEQIK